MCYTFINLRFWFYFKYFENQTHEIWKAHHYRETSVTLNYLITTFYIQATNYKYLLFVQESLEPPSFYDFSKISIPYKYGVRGEGENHTTRTLR